MGNSDIAARLVSHPRMGVQWMPIRLIKPNPQNTRTHSAKQVGQIKNSMVSFGFTNPLLVSEDGELIAGHGRYEAAKELGLETVPVIVVAGLSPAKRRALAIADNKIAENAGWIVNVLRSKSRNWPKCCNLRVLMCRFSASNRSKSTA